MCSLKPQNPVNHKNNEIIAVRKAHASTLSESPGSALCLGTIWQFQI